MLNNKSQHKIKISEQQDGYVISVGGSFSFDSHEQFRDAYEGSQEKEERTVKLDLSGVEGIDSSALGMLVIMHEYLRNKGIKTEIIASSPIINILMKNCDFGKHIPSFTVH